MIIIIIIIYFAHVVHQQQCANYITDREESVNVCLAKSAKVRLNCGVPQGSVFGPLLFVLYTSSNDMN